MDLPYNTYLSSIMYTAGIGLKSCSLVLVFLFFFFFDETPVDDCRQRCFACFRIDQDLKTRVDSERASICFHHLLSFLYQYSCGRWLDLHLIKAVVPILVVLVRGGFSF